MNTETYELLAPDVRTAAATVARKWPNTIESDDAEQEIWLRILEAGDSTIQKIVGMDLALRIASLTEMGHQIAAKERDDYELFSGNYRYGTDEVRGLLGEGALLPESAERPCSMTHTIRLDLTEGMRRLREKNEAYAETIVSVYVHGITPEDGSARMGLTRAVDALTLEMNRTHRTQIVEYTEGPGTRKAMSNEQAQRLTRSYLQGA